MISMNISQWVMGVGITIKADERWRVTIPAQLRDGFNKGESFLATRVGNDTIVLKRMMDIKGILGEIKGINLRGDRERASVDASFVKDVYGAVKT